MRDYATPVGRGTSATIGDPLRRIIPDRLGDIAARQIADGVDPQRIFLLVDLASDGIRIATVDPSTETVVAERMSSIRPADLDHLLATHLVRTGRVERPTSAIWTAELVELAGRGRSRLATAESAVVMGRDRVSFFRVTRSDLEEATEAIWPQVAQLCDEAAVAAPEEISSVVLTAGHEAWPGLATMLRRDAEVPVVVDGPGAFRSAGRPSDRRGETATRAPVARTSVGSAAVEQRTQPVERVDRLQDWPDDAPIPNDDPLPGPIASLAADRPPRSRKPFRRPLAGVGLVAVCALIGVGAAVVFAAVIALFGGEETPDSLSEFVDDGREASAPADPGSGDADPADPTTADPGVAVRRALAAARRPAEQYVPPPPPETYSSNPESTTGGPPARRGPQNRPPGPAPAPPPAPPPPPAPAPAPAPGPPQQRTVPNPIPGLPPIVLPF
ncbi:hypothetical protein VZC37_13910 [Gordonia sp. LSe1-13]|uniref:Uncharacterized protein n=1 Tax=Gordonia sesuvii TaxID=3116777 RepID=A0ABU7MEH6_9ACTN|nr:hypothetical protein [Gordonia sp. LSe1-13]